MAALKAALDGVKEGLRLSRQALGKHKHDQLVSAAITELLRELPDVDAAEAKLKAAEATGVEPDMQLLRARSMLSNARGFATKKRSAATRARWAKRSTKKTKRPQRRPKSRAKRVTKL